MSIISSINNSPVVVKLRGALQTAYKTVTREFSVLLGHTKNIMKGFEGVGVLASGNPIAKLALSVADSVKLFFEATMTIPKTHDLRILRSDMFEHVKCPDVTETRERRIQNLTEACDYIKQNDKRIRTTLVLAKQVGLVKHADKALNGIATGDEKALEEGEEFIRNLRRRVNTQLSLTAATLAAKIASTVSMISFIVTPPNPLTLIAAGVLGLGSLFIWGAEKIMLPADPFGQPKDVWHEKAPYKVRMACYKISEAVNSLFYPKKFANMQAAT